MQIPIDMDMRVDSAGAWVPKIPRAVTMKLYQAYFRLEGGHAYVNGFIKSEDGNWMEQMLEVKELPT